MMRSAASDTLMLACSATASSSVASRVIGGSDKIGGYPASDAQTPENLAATIYEALGLPRETIWKDFTGRPNTLYMGSPIGGLM